VVPAKGRDAKRAKGGGAIPAKTSFVLMFKQPVYKDWAFWVWAALAIFVLVANAEILPEIFTPPITGDTVTSFFALVIAALVAPWIFPCFIWLLPRYVIGKNRNKQIDIVTDRMLYTLPPMTPRRLFMNLPDDNASKGKTFEQLVRWLFKNDPRLTKDFDPSKIWLWAHYPKRWGPDNGIDLVAVDKTGATWAIQAKAWDPDRALNKSAVDSFLAESSRQEIAARMIVTTAVQTTDQLQQSISAQEKRVVVVDGNELAQADVDWESSNLMPLEKYMREQGVREAREKLGQ